MGGAAALRDSGRVDAAGRFADRWSDVPLRPSWSFRRRADEPSRVINNLSLDGSCSARPGRRGHPRRLRARWLGGALPGDGQPDGQTAGTGRFWEGALEDFAGFWPKQTDNPFTEVMDNSQKCRLEDARGAASVGEPTLLEGDAADAVAELKAEPDGDLHARAGALVRSLMQRGPVDEYAPLIHPLVLGSGCRLFTGGRHVHPAAPGRVGDHRHRRVDRNLSSGLRRHGPGCTRTDRQGHAALDLFELPLCPRTRA